MKRTILLSLLAAGAFLISGCAAYDNDAMAGDAVYMPDEKPMQPVLTPPPISPAPNSIGDMAPAR